MSKLILIRHGETVKNLLGRIHNYSDDDILTEDGTKQVLKTAEAIKSYKLDIIVSSREKRAKQTGEIIASVLKVKFDFIDGLEERNWGVYAGKSWSEIEAVLKNMSLEERYKFVPENGESWQQFENRLIKSIKFLIDKFPGKNLVVVTHGGVIRVLMPFLLGLPKEESFKYDLPNASISVFEILSSDKFRKETVGSVDHLKN